MFFYPIIQLGLNWYYDRENYGKIVTIIAILGASYSSVAFMFICRLLPLIDVRRSLLSLGFKVSKGEVRNMMADADLGATNG